MIWPNGAKCAFNLGFDLDGETIWRNKARRLPGGRCIYQRAIHRGIWS